MSSDKIILEINQVIDLFKGKEIKLEEGNHIIELSLDPYDVCEDKGDILSLIEDYWDNGKGEAS